MKTIPFSIGTIHFVGIGGIGMSGIAEILHNLGYSVQGSDMADNANVRRLVKLSIPVSLGHAAENIGDAKVVVVSSAVKSDNPEVVEARRRLLPVVRRAEMLAELMRLKWSIAVGGTHGKTTTTSMVAAVLDAAGMDPTVINGGIINSWGTNAHLGGGEWMVAEADESDGTFLKLPAAIAVVTNIDPEHLEHFGSIDALHQAFDAFVENIPFYGFAVLCIDHPEVQAMIPRIRDRRIVTYGFSPQADIRAVNFTVDNDISVFDVVVSERMTENVRTVEGFRLPMFGHHNVLNSLAAIAIAVEMGIDDQVMIRGLADFSGVKRRFTITGEVDGIRIVDDYGHHPVEIAAALRAARAACKGQVIAVVQPHRFSRLRDLFDDFCTCFNDADAVLVADVYPAGEEPISGYDSLALIQGLQTRGHRSVKGLDGPGDLATVISQQATSGDLVICLGAGSITTWANALPGELADLRNNTRGGVK